MSNRGQRGHKFTFTTCDVKFEYICGCKNNEKNKSGVDAVTAAVRNHIIWIKFGIHKTKNAVVSSDQNHKQKLVVCTEKLSIHCICQLTDWLCTNRFLSSCSWLFLFHYQKVHKWTLHSSSSNSNVKVLYGFRSRVSLSPPPLPSALCLSQLCVILSGKYFSTFLIIVRISSQPNKN